MVKKEKLSLDELMKQVILKDEDKPYEVPGNWIMALCTILSFEKGKKPEKLFIEEAEDYLPYVNIKCFETGIADQYTKKEYTNRFCVDNDILMVWDGARSGLVGIGVNGALGSTLCKVKFDKINSKYLFYYFVSNYENINKNGRGTGIPHVDPTYISNLPLPLPPIFEQQRIVDLIDSLFERLDHAKEIIQNALDSFENRKSAILHKAFTGELTTKWRDRNEVIDVNKTISELKSYRINTANSLAKQNKVENLFTYNEYGDNKNLPKSWKYVALDKLCDSFQYGTSKKSQNEGKVVVLRMGNLQSGKILWSNLAYTSDNEDVEKYSLKKGDVLFNRTNSPELVGKTSIYEGEQPAIFAGYLIRINNYKYLDSYYLNYVMNSPYAKEYCMNVKSDGVSQSNINAQKLAKFEIPLCSICEQKEIVRILDNLLGNEQKAKELSDVIENIDHIKKSILARAFRGQLNTNRSDEESPLLMLKTILQDKK